MMKEWWRMEVSAFGYWKTYMPMTRAYEQIPDYDTAVQMLKNLRDFHGSAAQFRLVHVWTESEVLGI